MDHFAFGSGSVFFHLIDIGWAEILARVAELGDATRVANIGIGNDQV